MRAAAFALLAAAAGSRAAQAQPLTLCPCNNVTQGNGLHPQHWFEAKAKAPPAGAFELRWVFAGGGSCISTERVDNCTLCKASPKTDLWRLDAATGQLSTVSTTVNATNALCLTAVLGNASLGTNYDALPPVQCTPGGNPAEMCPSVRTQDPPAATYQTSWVPSSELTDRL